ncbi:MAG: amidohydrolase family protein [Chloroflexota bacterium]|nr:amidohydrolase family protein [Chloroflexota bacterium]
MTKGVIAPKIRLVIVDFHTHIVPPWIKERRQDYLGRDALFDHLYANPKAKLATAEDLVTSMDEESIDVSVALNLGWISHELCVETNDYIMEAIARHPRRLVGFGAVQPTAGDAAVAEVERCASGGLKGIGELRPDVQGFDPGDEALMAPLVEMAARHDMILLTHASEPVGHQYAGKGEVTPDVLYRFITRFPQLPFVCAHWGGGLPFYALMPEVAAALKNVYFDTAATPFLYRPDIFRYVADIAGVDKVLFGTDYPLMRQSRVMDQVRSVGMGEKAEGLILGGNARRLLGV